MLAMGLTAGYRTAHTRPHRAIVKVEVWDDREQLDEISVLGGSVDCTLTSRVTRRGTLLVDPALMPQRESDLLAPFGNRLRIYRGIRTSSALDYLVPVFRGLIMKAERKPGALATITFSDRATEVDENDFEAAEETLAGANVVAEIKRLIREGVPGAEFGDSDAVAVQAASQVFDDSRAAACDQLADAAGAFWYALADGRFVVRRIPWTFQPDGADVEAVVEYNDGTPDHERPGAITDYGEVMSREGVYNVVVGEADQPNGDVPQRAVVRDNDPTSPTYVAGKFGRRVLTAEFPSAATAQVVRHGAAALRRRSRASAEAFPWEMVPDPTLELGDVVSLRLKGRARPLLRVLSDMTIPLAEGGSMSCSGRPIVLPDGTVITEGPAF